MGSRDETGHVGKRSDDRQLNRNWEYAARWGMVDGAMVAPVLLAVLLAQSPPDAGASPDGGRPGFDPRFALVKVVAPGPAESIGLPGAGCLKGAAVLPKQAKDMVITRPERNRVFGHPALIAYLKAMAKGLGQAGLGPLHVGDLGQPIGGPTPTGHRSHQNGLDVDLWFAPVKDPKGPAPVLVDLKTTKLLPAWNKKVIDRLRLFAAAPDVDRIFVHPAIKRALCREAPGPWLHVLRPWWGHHDHLHVRLRCPPDSPACQDGSPLPEGDGCDKHLDWWCSEDSKTTKTKKGPPGQDAPTMPEACLELVAPVR